MQRIRLAGADAGRAVADARAFMREHALRVGSWWVSDRSTPADLDERLLAEGLCILERDYRVDGMLLTVEPPDIAEGLSVREAATLEDYVAATEAQWEAFGTPADRRHDPAHEYELEREADVVRLYAAWLDGRVVGAGRGIFTPRGVLLSGGSTVPAARGRGVYRALVRARWDAAVERGTPALAVQAGAMSRPILARLGFETVCRFRRLEDVAST